MELQGDFRAISGWFRCIKAHFNFFGRQYISTPARLPSPPHRFSGGISLNLFLSRFLSNRIKCWFMILELIDFFLLFFWLPGCGFVRPGPFTGDSWRFLEILGDSWRFFGGIFECNQHFRRGKPSPWQPNWEKPEKLSRNPTTLSSATFIKQRKFNTHTHTQNEFR